MIQALRFEPFGQRQRFEPREQQSSEEQNRHIHLHFHLHLTLRASQGRSTPHNAMRVTRIFAALVAATAMFITIPLLRPGASPDTPLLVLAGPAMQLGLLIAWVATWLGGLPLLISAWRSTPRVRFLLAFPFLPILITIFLIFVGLGSIFDVVLPVIGHPMALICLFYGYPLISTLLLTRAIRRATIRNKWLRIANWLSFVVVGGLVLMLLSTLLWSLSLLLTAPAVLSNWRFWLPVLGMELAVIFATSTLFSWSRSRERAQEHPKDASPSDVDSFLEP